MSDERIRRTVEELSRLLASADYREIETLTSGTRLSSEEIAGVIAEYGRTVIIPPTEAYDYLDTIEVAGAATRTWSVTMPLWTAEEGRSDLSMELTLLELFDGTLRVELDNLHVA